MANVNEVSKEELLRRNEILENTNQQLMELLHQTLFNTQDMQPN